MVALSYETPPRRARCGRYYGGPIFQFRRYGSVLVREQQVPELSHQGGIIYRLVPRTSPVKSLNLQQQPENKTENWHRIGTGRCAHCPLSTASIAVAAMVSVCLNKWPYTLVVVLTFACPMRLEIVSGSTPLAISADTWLWRSP